MPVSTCRHTHKTTITVSRQFIADLFVEGRGVEGWHVRHGVPKGATLIGVRLGDKDTVHLDYETWAEVDPETKFEREPQKQAPVDINKAWQRTNSPKRNAPNTLKNCGPACVAAPVRRPSA